METADAALVRRRSGKRRLGKTCELEEREPAPRLVEFMDRVVALYGVKRR